MVLYVLMPDDLEVGYPPFFTIFICAIAVGILSHASSGRGVFEATWIAGLESSGRSDMIAALLLYRIVYTFLPFAFAGLSIAVAHRRRLGARRPGSIAPSVPSFQWRLRASPPWPAQCF